MPVSVLLSNPVTSTLVGAVVFVLLQAAVILCGFPATLTLKRAFPVNHRIELSQVRHRDSWRTGIHQVHPLSLDLSFLLNDTNGYGKEAAIEHMQRTKSHR
ncbi:hypothetical protein L2E82_52171 [Cichorium intybus]|nr:hypothetical protein L2E82_52171 [Cichorium intybus]